jgi:hypothetical protein
MKVGLISVLYFIYKRNLHVVWDFFQILFRYSNQQFRKDNTILEKVIQKRYQKQYELHLEGFEKLSSYPPGILAANYVNDRMENSACMFFPNTATMMIREFKCLFGNTVKHCIYRPKNGKSFHDVESQILNHHSNGRHIFAYVTAFPELHFSNYVRMRTGIFTIAQKHGIPIIPVAIDHIRTTNIGSIPKQPFSIRIGDLFYVDNITLSKNRVKQFHKQALNDFFLRKFEN